MLERVQGYPGVFKYVWAEDTCLWESRDRKQMVEPLPPGSTYFPLATCDWQVWRSPDLNVVPKLLSVAGGWSYKGGRCQAKTQG